jgi:hypothetical protein
MSDVVIHSVSTGEDFPVDAQLGYVVSRASENVIHRIMNRADPDVTLKPTPLRTGTFEALIHGQTDAEALAYALGRPSKFAWTSEGFASILFVVSGPVQIRQEDNLSSYVVSFEFTEVAA